MSEDLAGRIKALEDRNAVAETIYAYARAIRHKDARAAADCFHADGIFDILVGHPGQTDAPARAHLGSREDIYDYLVGSDVMTPSIVPVADNMIVRLDGDTAHAGSVLVIHRIGGDPVNLAEYEDRLERRDGQWRLVHRRCTLFVPRAAD